jgi:four helix bundle protein
MKYDYSFSFEKLGTWQDARGLVKLVYSITADFPKHEIYGLVSQMRRAASSISSNLSEGSGRSSTKDQAHFYQISYSSNLELLNHFYTALDLSYIDEKTFEKLRNLVCALSFKINALRKSRISSTASTASTP